jgi:hypothetical protein
MYLQCSRDILNLIPVQKGDGYGTATVKFRKVMVMFRKVMVMTLLQ